MGNEILCDDAVCSLKYIDVCTQIHTDVNHIHTEIKYNDNKPSLCAENIIVTIHMNVKRKRILCVYVLSYAKME